MRESESIIETLGLIFMSLLKKEDRDKLVEADFEGHDFEVAAIKSKAVSELQRNLQRHGMQWDGKKPIHAFIVEEFRLTCMETKALRLARERLSETNKVVAFLDGMRRLNRGTDLRSEEELAQIDRFRKVLSGMVVANV